MLNTIELTKELIKAELKEDGSLKNRTYLTKFYSSQELYNYFNDCSSSSCKICSKETRFLNFKLGYDNVCSRSCRKKLKAKEFIPDLSSTVSLEELKEFILKEFKDSNTSNKLNIAYFVNNNYIKELNTILDYMSKSGEQNLNIKVLHELIFGCSVCTKCLKSTKFNGFSEKGTETCSIKCANSKHILEDINVDYVLQNFIKDNKFRVKEMMRYYNVSYSFVNKFKLKHNITTENKHKKYSFGEQLLFNVYSKDYKVLTNSKKIIYPYEIDFVIEYNNEKICIEFDGLLFHSKGNSYPGDCSKRFKYNLIKSKKVELFTIFENEFLDENKRKIWFSIINNKLSKNICIDSNYCYIKEVQAKESSYFFNLNHLEPDLFNDRGINIGCYYKGVLISLVNFSGNKINLLCSKIDYSSVTIKTIIRYIKDSYKLDYLIYYSNNRFPDYSCFEDYEVLGRTESNIFYFKINENILYRTTKEDEEMLLEKGYRIIYDYGNTILKL